LQISSLGLLVGGEWRVNCEERLVHSMEREKKVGNSTKKPNGSIKECRISPEFQGGDWSHNLDVRRKKESGGSEKQNFQEQGKNFFTLCCYGKKIS